MKILSSVLIFCSTITLLCSCEKKNYSVEVSDGYVNVKMHCPSMGIVGINQVSYDGFTYEEVEKEIFDKIRSRSYDDSYTISVTLQFRDSYGNYYDGENVTVSTISAREAKKYASYSFFKGQTHLEKAFPWNHKYDTTKSNNNSLSLPHQKKSCSHCNNGIIITKKKTTQTRKCQACNGTGNLGMKECTFHTHQEAREPLYDSNGKRLGRALNYNGDPCGGSGYIKITCSDCNGRGTIVSYITEESI